MSRSDVPFRVVDDVDLTTQDLVAWSGAPASPDASDRVSLYLPTHRAGREVTQDPVRLRQLIGLARAEAGEGELLAAIGTFVQDRSLRGHGVMGLALLVDRTGATAIRLSEPPAELVVVSDRFHLKPLIAAIGRRLAFDVLALGRHRVRLVRVDGSRAVEAEVPGLPTSMTDALRWDDREPQLQSHAAGRIGAGRVAAAFHGQGGTGDAREADLDRYLRLVDRPVVAHRSGSTRPLVLAGVDEIVAAYRRLTSCAHLADAHIGGSPDQLRAAELADRGRRFVRPSTAAAEHEAREAFLAGAAATVDTVEQAVIAAAAGRVTSIFVPADRASWGRYHPGHRRLDEHDERQAGDHDLTDVAATETLRHGGLAFVVPASEVPGGGTAAATLRY